MKVITKVLVGSRLHGLAGPDADWDWRGVHIHTLKEVLSPWSKVKNTDWIEGDQDNTSYELADFCKQATHGNATILEVFFSDQVAETSPIAEEMRRHWAKFIDTDKFVMASRGFAANQLNKMQLFDDIGVKDQKRTAKFAAAYVRVMWQCDEFLRTGKFQCAIPEGEIKDMMVKVRKGWKDEYIPECTELFVRLQANVTESWKGAEKMKPDIPWIEDFIYRSYAR